jgi:uncharacterized protein with HEPN domain
VSDEFRETHPEILWSDAMGIRHKIVHDYFEISYTILWSVIREELAGLAEALERLLADSR